MRKFAFLMLLVSQIVFANDTCIDVPIFAQMKRNSNNKNSEINKIMEFYQGTMRPKILYQLDRSMIAENIKLNDAPFKIRWKFDKNGGIDAKCDCEEILEISNDISEARSVLKLLKPAVLQINKLKANLNLSPEAQKLEYCATGKFKTESINTLKNETKKSTTGTSQ